MNKIKNGDIVGRKSYNKDIIFIVVDSKDTKNVILKGIFERIIADSNISDLELIDSKTLEDTRALREKKIEEMGCKRESKFVSGKILHLDGDKKYSEKSLRYYRKMGIRAVVKNVPEIRQPKVVYSLLKIYEPDILVITGHDSMIRKEKGYYDIYNYKNSRFFLATVLEARRYEKETNSDLVIFAGACQSYYEALIQAGANFASSPARILIDILDPLIVAKEVATTDNYRFVRIEDIEYKLRDGIRGVGGIGANGKKMYEK